MSCARFRELAPAYVYDILEAGAAIEVRRHLDACQMCAAWLAPVKARICREIIDSISEYRESALDPAERASFDIHLAVCSACRDYLKSYEATVALGKQAHRHKSEATPPLPKPLLKAILAARLKKPE